MSVAETASVRAAINGNPSNRALRAPVEPDPNYLADLTPAPFLTSIAAIQVWEYLAPKLAKAPRLMREVDTLTFARYCVDVADYWEAQPQVSALLRDGGADASLVVMGGTGSRNAPPVIALRSRAADRVDKGAMEFGLGPDGPDQDPDEPRGEPVRRVRRVTAQSPDAVRRMSHRTGRAHDQGPGTAPGLPIRRRGQCGRIQTKEGELRPQVLNEAQRYINKLLQERLTLKGMFRAPTPKDAGQVRRPIRSGASFTRPR